MPDFDPDTGWVVPWPYSSIDPADVEPFVGRDGRDPFDGTQLRDPEWWERRIRARGRFLATALEERLADEETDVGEVLAKAASVFADLAKGALA